jgi:tRNA pseudouridine55 synthase
MSFSQAIHGILLLDKPAQMTSNGALQRVKRLFGAKKAGHTGSLDPLATGMLPICFGEATKLSQYLLEADKYYRVEITLGVRTNTGDAEGEIIETRPASHVTEEQIQAVIPSFLGDILQVPPMFSAIKMNGKPLYELARQGIEIERQPRAVHIHQLTLEEKQGTCATFFIHCSKGTYVRTIAEEVGEKLGCGAHVSQLRRVAVAPYEKAPMITLAELEQVQKEQGTNALQHYLIPLESSVQGFPAIKLSTSAAFYLRTGQSVTVPHLPSEGLVRIFSEHADFMGIGEITNDGRVAPRRLLNAPRSHLKNPL